MKSVFRAQLPTSPRRSARKGSASLHRRAPAIRALVAAGSPRPRESTAYLLGFSKRVLLAARTMGTSPLKIKERSFQFVKSKEVATNNSCKSKDVNNDLGE